MKVLICEDETPASRMLSKLIQEASPSTQIVGVAETGEEALKIINSEKLDLIFMDIELADGSCFEVLEGVEIKTPVIFTTAYDEYALKAFELNAIDYLVKPISFPQLQKAIDKFIRFKEVLNQAEPFMFKSDFLRQEGFKKRFLVKYGRKLFPMAIEEIAYFMANDKLVWLVSKNRKKFVINYTLSELEDLLDPNTFFRLNRQFIVQLDSIVNLEPYFKGQVIVNLEPEVDQEIIISRNKTPELKAWLGI